MKRKATSSESKRYRKLLDEEVNRYQKYLKICGARDGQYCRLHDKGWPEMISIADYIIKKDKK